MKNYLASININAHDELNLELKKYALENNVPIIQDEGLAFLRQIIQIKKPLRILEIGSAIGYSAINMAKCSKAFIDTIEINEQMYNKALENIDKANLNDRIKVFHADALEINIEDLSNYDIIFIDAAKAQYKKFFLKFKELLNNDGIIITDNLLFHGLVLNENIESKNLRRLVEKIKDYNTWLVSQEDFQSTIYDIGDGMALSIKK